MTGLIHELAIMLLFGASATVAGYLIGARSIWLMLAAGVLAMTAARVVTFSVLNMFDLLTLSSMFFIILAMHVLVLGVIFCKQKQLLAKGLLLSTPLSLVAVLATRVIGLSPVGHGDSKWILTIASHMQNSGDMGLLNGRTSIKRGFAYPQLLALGPEGEYLSAITPFIFASLIAASIWFLLTISKSVVNPRLLAIAASIVLVAVITATVPWRAIFYINGHTLTSLGMTVAVAAVVLAIKDGKLSDLNRNLIMLGFFITATSRPEGIAMAALIALPLLSRTWISRRDQALVISSATSGLATWLSVYNSYIINETTLPWFVFSAIFIGLGLIPTLKIFDAIRFRLVPLAFAAMVLVIGLAQVFFTENLAKGNASQIANLIFGEGLWGYLAIGLGLVLVIIGIAKTSNEYRLLLSISLLLILGTLIAKMLDGGQFGNPTLGREGWSDSLNRMWIHSFAIVVITVITGLVERMRKA